MNQLVESVKLTSVKKKYTKEEFRKGIIDFEEKLKLVPGALIGHEMDEEMCPLKHTFVDGTYVREIHMPKGIVLTSKIHKITHPYFILRGDVSVATEDGIKRIKAPYSGVTLAGTKRLLYMHEDTVWLTCHSNKNNTTNLDEIEKEIIAESFEEYEEFKKLNQPEKRRIRETKQVEVKDESSKIALERFSEKSS